jgi:hypothetical protein
MSPLLRKEIRLIAAPAVLAVFAAALPFLWRAGLSVALVVFGVAMLVVAIAPFGKEVSAGTFALLLAQPVERRHLWRLKLRLLLGVLFVAAMTLWWAVQHWFAQTQFPPNEPVPNPHGVAAVLVSLVAAMCATGLWTTVLFRQVSVAVCLTALVPLALSAAVLSLKSDKGAEWVMSGVLLVYSVAGFVLARRLFLSCEDKQWTGGVLSLPAWLSRDETQNRTRRSFRPWRALLRKELQLQRATFLVAAGLAGLHLIGVFTRRWLAHASPASHTLTGVLELVGMLSLFVPLMAGCVAVAEERRGGTWEVQLALPVARWRQFWVKLLVVILSAVLFGAVIPHAIELLGSAIGLRWAWGGFAGSLVGFAGVSGAIAMIGFYASTLARNVVEAFTVALGLGGTIAAGFMLNDMVMRPEWSSTQALFWPQALLGFVGPYVLLLLGLLLSIRNFPVLQITGALRWRNAGIALGTMVCLSAAAAALFNRVWEFAGPVEGEHAAARFHPSDVADFRAAGLNMTARFTDGRVWVHSRRYIPALSLSEGRMLGRYAEESGFLAGSDWRAVAANYDRVTALRRDGTLWHVPSALASAQQVGTQRDWRKLAAGDAFFAALKSDGTLWAWGSAWVAQRSRIGTNQPLLLEARTCWTNLMGWGTSLVAECDDGTITQWDLDFQSATASGGMIQRIPAAFLTTNPVAHIHGDRGAISVATLRNGTLLVFGRAVPRALFSRFATMDFRHGDTVLVLSSNSVWKQAVVNYGHYPFITALSHDAPCGSGVLCLNTNAAV